MTGNLQVYIKKETAPPNKKDYKRTKEKKRISTHIKDSRTPKRATLCSGRRHKSKECDFSPDQVSAMVLAFVVFQMAGNHKEIEILVSMHFMLLVESIFFRWVPLDCIKVRNGSQQEQSRLSKNKMEICVEPNLALSFEMAGFWKRKQGSLFLHLKQKLFFSVLWN